MVNWKILVVAFLKSCFQARALYISPQLPMSQSDFDQTLTWSLHVSSPSVPCGIFQFQTPRRWCCHFANSSAIQPKLLCCYKFQRIQANLTLLPLATITLTMDKVWIGASVSHHKDEWAVNFNLFHKGILESSAWMSQSSQQLGKWGWMVRLLKLSNQDQG